MTGWVWVSTKTWTGRFEIYRDVVIEAPPIYRKCEGMDYGDFMVQANGIYNLEKLFVFREDNSVHDRRSRVWEGAGSGAAKRFEGTSQGTRKFVFLESKANSY